MSIPVNELITKVKVADIKSILSQVFVSSSGGGGVWGTITGTLSNQTDLQNALNAKLNTGLAWLLGSGGILTADNTITQAGFNLIFSGGNVISDQNGSNAVSAATQVGSSAYNFKSSLWNGSAEAKGWFSWRSEASTSVNLLNILRLYQSSGSSPGFSTQLLEITGGTNIMDLTIGQPTPSGASGKYNIYIYASDVGGEVSKIAFKYNGNIYEVISGFPNNGTFRFGSYSNAGFSKTEFYNNGVLGMAFDIGMNLVLGIGALATNATGGFLQIPSCAGPPTGTPTAYSGRIPIVYDSTNNFLYIYNGGWKKSTVYS